MLLFIIIVTTLSSRRSLFHRSVRIFFLFQKREDSQNLKSKIFDTPNPSSVSTYNRHHQHPYPPTILSQSFFVRSFLVFWFFVNVFCFRLRLLLLLRLRLLNSVKKERAEKATECMYGFICERGDFVVRGWLSVLNFPFL